MVVLGVGPGAITTSPMDLIGGRRRLLGSPSGSRHDLRAALNFSAHHHVVPRLTKITLEEAPKALESMRKGTLRGRAVIVFD